MEIFISSLYTQCLCLVVQLCGIINGITASQELVDYLAENLQVQYSVLSNMETGSDGGPRARASLQLTNLGPLNVTDTAWELYLCSIRLWEPDTLRPTPGAVARLGGTGLRVEHVTGCLHRVTAGAGFRGFISDMTMLVPFLTSDWQAAKTDVSPNWYVSARGARPRTLFYTAGETLAFVDDFTTPEQWKRREYDNYEPYTPQERYKMWRGVRDSGRADIPVLPTPRSYQVLSQHTVNLTRPGWQIAVPGISMSLLGPAASILSKKLEMPVVFLNSNAFPTSLVVILQTGLVRDKDGEIVSSPEAYEVHVDAVTSLVRVTGMGPAGVLHGVQTLLSLAHGEETLREVHVVDWPRYEYRGMHVDVARNFQSKGAILLLLDVMSMYKLNKFHFHLTDDEGWRLQIPGLEELTEVGGQRCHDLDENECIMSQLGSGPGIDTSGSGYYTVADYRDILRFARDREIEVIPEFDMPGHAHAAIKAMEARYHRLLPLGDPSAAQYLLSDPEDRSTYLSIQYFRDNAVNPCITSTYNFISKLVHEVAAMHADIQPLKVFHFGGDEVPEGAWEKSPACEGGPGARELKQTFVEQVARIVKAEGLGLAGWEDGLMLNTSSPYARDSIDNPDVYAYAWNNIWEWGGGSRAYTLANHGYKVVISHATALYFDHPAEPDPEERGLYWASRYTDLRGVLAYTPQDVYANIRADLWGKPLLRENVCRAMGCVELEEGKEENIVGIQGQLWSETVRTESQLFSMVFPRLLALAERAWHRAAWEGSAQGDPQAARDEEWGRFANTLGHKELARLDELGVEYRIPCPGAVVSHDGALHTVNSLPGLVVQYSADGGATWADANEGVTVPYAQKILLRTRSPNGLRTSRVVSIMTPKAPPTRGQPPPTVAQAPPPTTCSPLILVIVSITWHWLGF